ncbi:MAG: ATP phosphoribosyltransferase regulatory subunit [Lachnospiraceae bacterium]|nr:ATP phosphoribosyltransferase regulatory subunit [Lachnospiraceae bacterium]
MTNRLLHTPEGVRDIYGEELKRKNALKEKLKALVSSYGYSEIETPTFEYFDVFLNDIGTTPSREIYKFFDSENNTLALRPDFTPGAARAAAKYFLDEKLPVRLSYLGQTFTNSSELQGKLKEVTELGLEYMGDPTVDADAEIINLAVQVLLSSGLSDFQLCIGNAEYFKGLCEYASLDSETIKELTENIRNKNYFGTLDALNDVEISREIRETLQSFPDFFGGAEVLSEAEEKVKDIPRSLEAVKRLKELYKRLQVYGVEKYLTFDLGMLSKHDYYTGIVFRAYTFGTGEAVIRGGRYDNLLKAFGKDKAAIGFTVVIDQLLLILNRQHIEDRESRKRSLVLYTPGCFEKALIKAGSLREGGSDTAMTPVPNKNEIHALRDGLSRMDYDAVYFLSESGEEVLSL